MDVDLLPEDAARTRAAWTNRETSPDFVTVGQGAEKHLQHPQLWFEDGNVLVISRNVWFKLHRGILSRFSSVFRDMFQLADAEAGHHIQHCPAVDVTDDPAHLHLFFTLLYDGGRHPFLLDPHWPMEFSDARGVVLLASKYDVQHLRTEALRRLEVCFPTTLDGWDRRYPHSCSGDADPPTAALLLHPADSIAAVALARRLALPALLPAAFFRCAMLPPERALARVRYGADDVAALARDDAARWLRGLGRCHARAAAALLPAPRAFAAATRAVCTRADPGACPLAWAQVCGEFLGSRHARSADVLWDVSGWLERADARWALCPACVAAVREMCVSSRRRAWAWLSEAFDL